MTTVRTDDRAIIGGLALPTTVTRFAEDEITRTCLISSPFSHWKGGKRNGLEAFDDESGKA